MDNEQKEFRTIFNPRISANTKAFWQDYDTQKEAETALNAIANFTLYCHDQEIFPDYSNVGQVVKWEDGEWREIDEDGNFID